MISVPSKVLSTSILHRTHVENSMSGLQSSRESRYLHTAPLREAWLAPNTSAHAPARKWRLRHLQCFDKWMLSTASKTTNTVQQKRMFLYDYSGSLSGWWQSQWWWWWWSSLLFLLLSLLLLLRCLIFMTQLQSPSSPCFIDDETSVSMTPRTKRAQAAWTRRIGGQGKWIGSPVIDMIGIMRVRLSKNQFNSVQFNHMNSDHFNFNH